MDSIYNELIAEGFERVERDDRLLDVFVGHKREKGIELWDKWGADTVEIIRLHIPKGEKGITRYVFLREKIEKALMENRELALVPQSPAHTKVE